jgi:hypothetical protein
MPNIQKLRNRNVAHSWQDKRVLRFFRSFFDRKDSKNLHLVYYALCEVESDFCETKLIQAFSSTVAKYASMDEDVAGCYLRALRKGGFIDYYQQNQEGVFGQTRLELFEFDPSVQGTSENSDHMKRVIANGAYWREEDRNPIYRGTVRPLPDLSGAGYIGPHKDKNEEKDSSERSKNLSEKEYVATDRGDGPSFTRTIYYSSNGNGHTPKEKSSRREQRKEFMPIARVISAAVRSRHNIRHSESQLESWCKDLLRLSTVGGVPFDRQMEVVKAFAEKYPLNIEYCPVVESGKSFREKFTKVLDFLSRQNGNSNGNGGGHGRVRPGGGRIQEGHQYKRADYIYNPVTGEKEKL